MASAGRSTEQARLAQDVDALPTLAWAARPDGSAEFLNRRWLDYTGLSIEEASDWGWAAALHTEDRDRLLDFWRCLLASGEAGEIEARLRRHDGDYRWFLFRVEPVRDSHGGILKWYGANTDIEDRKRAEALLAAEKRTLEMIANGACLADILERLCETIDAQASNIRTAVMLMDADGIHLRPEEAADRLAIRELVEAYAHCADRRDAKGQMALFTADTHFVVYMNALDPTPTQELHSREALAPVFADLNQYAATMHFLGQTTILTLTRDRGTGETYCMPHHLTIKDGKRRLMIAALRYMDAFVKMDGAWLFAERQLYVDWIEERPLS